MAGGVNIITCVFDSERAFFFRLPGNKTTNRRKCTFMQSFEEFLIHKNDTWPLDQP